MQLPQYEAGRRHKALGKRGKQTHLQDDAGRQASDVDRRRRDHAELIICDWLDELKN